MKLNNKTFFIILLILIMSIIIFWIFKSISMNDISQKAIISSEMEKINTNSIIDFEIKSTGKYAKVEQALKNYITDYQTIVVDISSEFQNEKITTILSANNYKTDGPDFVQSKGLISSVMAKAEDAKSTILEMNTMSYKERYASDCGLKGKYKELFINSIQLESELENMEISIDLSNDYLSKINSVLNFLSNIKDKWSIVDDKIEFEEESQVSKYTSLLNLVSEASEKLQ